MSKQPENTDKDFSWLFTNFQNFGMNNTDCASDDDGCDAKVQEDDDTKKTIVYGKKQKKIY